MPLLHFRPVKTGDPSPCHYAGTGALLPNLGLLRGLGLLPCAALLLVLPLVLGCESSESSTAPASIIDSLSSEVAPPDTLAVNAALAGGDPAEPSSTDSAAPNAKPAANTVEWAERQLRQMSLDEKIAQLFIIRLNGRFQNAQSPSYQQTVSLVEEFGAGGMMFGPGTPMTQVAMANDLQRKAEVPLLVSQDTEWGVGMRIDEATSFPPAMALGAARDASLSYRVGHATAQEARALGVHQLYAPVADVNNNPNNPIINVRSFGEKPELVGTLASAFARGAREGGTLATVKHFPGHGDTDVDSHRNLPVLRFDRARLDSLELVPFRQVLDDGIASVMTGHLALPSLEPNASLPASLSRNVTTDLLRTELGFDGLVVTDALNMNAVRREFGAGETAVRVLEAGADLILMSTNPRVAHDAIRRAVDRGRLTPAEIDESVRRLLEAKQELGLHEKRRMSSDTTRHRVGRRSHEVLSETVARQSLTLLANKGNLLPLTPPDEHSALIVKLSDSESPSVGEPFVEALSDYPAIGRIDVRRLDPRSDAEDVHNHLQAAQGYDVVIVPSYLRVRAWSGSIGFKDLHREFLERIIANGPPTILTAFGNPYAPSGLNPQPDAVLAAYGSGAASQKAAAQALVGAAGTPGRLPVNIPDLAEMGTGNTLVTVSPRFGHPEEVGMDGQRLARVDSILRNGIRERAFPGAAVAVGRGDVITKLDGHGYYTYEHKKRVQTSSQYDLASLTKVVATTTAVMLLVEEGRLELDAPVSRYLPRFAQHGKDAVTVRQLLAHSSGLKPYLGPDERGPTPGALLDTLMAQSLSYPPGTTSTYSGLNFIALTRIVETVTNTSFDVFCRTRIFEPLDMNQTRFYDTSRRANWVVPTTDTAGSTYRGSVHDPMARVMDGVAGNAGLFSTARDLSRFAYMLTHGGRIDGKQFLKPETIKQFITKADVPGSTRALGWDTKSEEGYSSAGNFLSASSFGHTGYTGTSLWIDPTEELFVLLLTNRVYPDDTSEQIQQIRPKVANEVYKSIVGPPQPLLPGTNPTESVSKRPSK